jgi:hypothetical protein
MKTTVSFEFQGSDTEVVAEIVAFIAKLDPSATVAEPAKVRAPRPKRVLTEAERQAIRERFAAGKAKAALARTQAAIPALVVDVKPEPAKQPKVFEIKPDANHKSGSVKPAPKPMPVKGRKVEAKPHAQ